MIKTYLLISPRNPHLIWKNLLFFKSNYVQCNCSWLRKCAINIFHFICVCFGEEFIFKTPRSKICNFVLISHRYSHSNSTSFVFVISFDTVVSHFYFCYHDKPRFHVNDLLRNWIREKRFDNFSNLCPWGFNFL